MMEKEDVYLELEGRQLLDYLTEVEIGIIANSFPIDKSGLLESEDMEKCEGGVGKGPVKFGAWTSPVRLWIEYNVHKVYVIKGAKVPVGMVVADEEVKKGLPVHLSMIIRFAIIYTGDMPDEVLDRFNDFNHKFEEMKKEGKDVEISKFSKK